MTQQQGQHQSQNRVFFFLTFRGASLESEDSTSCLLTAGPPLQLCPTAGPCPGGPVQQLRQNFLHNLIGATRAPFSFVIKRSWKMRIGGKIIIGIMEVAGIANAAKGLLISS